jgi:hypothetical protein
LVPAADVNAGAFRCLGSGLEFGHPEVAGVMRPAGYSRPGVMIAVLVATVALAMTAAI